MGLTAEIEQVNQSYKDKIESIMGELKNKVLSGPDNADIKRISSGIFTMPFSKLSNRSWSPEFYDFQYQYKLIVEKLELVPSLDIPSVIQRMIDDRSVTFGTPKRTYKLHDKVIDHLETLK